MPGSQALILSLSIVLSVTPVLAQSKPETIPDRTVIPAVLKTSVDAKDVKLGKDLELAVTDDVRDGSGKILIPKQAKLTGRVTEAVQWMKDSPESRLSIIVEKADWKKGSVILRAFIAGEIKIYTTAGNPKPGVSDVVATITNAPAMQLPVNPSLTQDKSVTVQMATSKELVTELVSHVHNVRVEQGSTLSLRQLSQ